MTKIICNFDLEKLRGIKTSQEYLKLKDNITEKGLSYDEVSTFSACTNFSVIALYHFIKEDFPRYANSCDVKITMLIGFYGY